MAHKQFIPADIQEKMKLAKDGKLWSLWVAYNVRGLNETKVLKLPNLTAEQVKKHRESMFRYGFTIHLEQGHWKIICPMDIVDVDLFKQSVYIFESNMPVDYGIV